MSGQNIVLEEGRVIVRLVETVRVLCFILFSQQPLHVGITDSDTT